MNDYYNFERSFVKALSNSLKNFPFFATALQNNEKIFEGLREAFSKKFPYNLLTLS